VSNFPSSLFCEKHGQTLDEDRTCRWCRTEENAHRTIGMLAVAGVLGWAAALGFLAALLGK
jgi:hypothetical protein